MARKKVGFYRRKICASVARQYRIEAQDLHMSLSSYIAWLKAKAGYSTVYDAFNERHEPDSIEELGTRLAKRLMEV